MGRGGEEGRTRSAVHSLRSSDWSQLIMNTGSTRKPWRWSSSADTAESTPPDKPTATSGVNDEEGKMAGEGAAAVLLVVNRLGPNAQVSGRARADAAAGRLAAREAAARHMAGRTREGVRGPHKHRAEP